MSIRILSLVSQSYTGKTIKQFLACASINTQQVRRLQVHEHVAYTLLKDAGIPTPPFGVAKTAEEAAKIAESLKSKDIVIKAQVLAGGRGVGKFQNTEIGGVVMCETPQQAKDLASKMIGNLLITKQTGSAGRICNSVMVTTRMFPRKEYYMAVMLEQTYDGPVVIVSKQGGVNIEDIAAKSPDAISYIPVNIMKGLTVDQVNKVVEELGVQGKDKDIVGLIACNLYELFIKKDALLLEINPLALDLSGEYFALDCKCSFDDSAEFRQKKLFSFRDLTQEDPNEVQASKFSLNYIALTGNIGCMVNGAGLAMATMDLIKLYGGMPANFLDVGGSATKEAVTEAFKIIISDAKVEAIFINIFGGIMRCDIIAEGIIAASKELKLTIPVVVRLQGTNVEKARKLIADAQLRVFPVDDFATAAESAVKLSTIIFLAHSMNLEVSFKLRKRKGKKGRGSKTK